MMGLTPVQAVTQSRSRRRLGELEFDVWIEESHEDSLMITEHPVEQGAAISDHAYLKPSTVSLRVGVANSLSETRCQEVYDTLRELQGKREPIDIVTGLRVYKNMLIETLATSTDATSENAKIITADCRAVIIVRTQVTSVPPRSRHANARRTGGVTDTGAKQPQEPKKSALAEGFGGGNRRPGGPAKGYE